MQVKNVLAAGIDEKRYRSLAEKYDWRPISQRYGQVLSDATKAKEPKNIMR